MPRTIKIEKGEKRHKNLIYTVSNYRHGTPFTTKLRTPSEKECICLIETEMKNRKLLKDYQL